MDAAPGRPSGTVTFLLTDVEGSTRLWEHQELEMEMALELHDGIMRSTIAEHGGYVFSTAGDAFAAAFGRAGDAVAAVRSAQTRLDRTSWPTEVPIKVRMGLHTGEAHERDGDYFGPVVNRAARIMSVGHGGQTLVSATTAALVGESDLVDLGDHRLKDLGASERVFQLDGRAGDHPPLRSLSNVRNNLPVQRTELFGRERDVERVVEMLRTSRLVTLTGVGGVGKTRLAIAAAAEALDDFEDGVFFVDLVPIGSDSEVIGQIAHAVGLERAGSVEERLFELLARRRVLVVIDNCEHVVDEVADVVDRALGRNGRAHLLATSREDLEVEGERTLRVPSLTFDGQETTSPAVGLFVDRADALGITGVDHAAAREICARLDGIPLAIELAAAQLTHFSTVDLLDRLDRRFDLLSGGRRRRRQRQQTLQGVMDWSWELLAPQDRTLLARLSVLTGAWTLDEAQGICGDGDDDSVAAGIGALVLKSLVHRLDDTDSSRFRLLETVRLYAQQRLVDHGEADELRGRHLRYFVTRCGTDDLAERIVSLSHVAWYRQSFDNVVAAIDWATSVGDHDAATTLIFAGTTQVFGQIGFAGRRLVEAADDLLRDVEDPTLRARLLVAQSWMGWNDFDVELIHRSADRAVEAARQGDDVHALVFALATATFFRDDRERWDANFAEAHAAAEASGSWVAVDLAATFLDGAHYEWADTERLAVDAPSRIGRRDRPTVMDLANLATTTAAAFAIGDRELATWALDRQADLIAELGIPASWMEQFGRALIAALDGDAAEAAARLRQARDLDRIGRVGPSRGEFLLVPAVLAELDGRNHDCAVLLAVIRTDPVPMHETHPVTIYRQLRRRTGEALSADEITSARSEAASMSVDRALDDFLGTVVSSTA